MNFGEDRSGVGYALYVRDNIKRDDYFRDITGGIHKTAYIKENRVYYVFGDIENPYWVNIAAIKNFQENVTDLIEVGDYVNGNRMDIVEKNEKGQVYYSQNEELPCVAISEIETILTHEQYSTNCYKVGG